MRAILMAGGIGSRLGSKDKSKCMWPVNGKPLIEHTIRMLLENGVDVSVVTGYKSDAIVDAMRDYPITWHFNPFFRVTNSIGSMWFAMEDMTGDEDVILASADVYWDDSLLNLLKEDKHDVTLLGDVSRAKIGDYLFKLENGYIVKHGKAKDMPMEDRDCENLGVARLKASFVPGFRERLEKLIKEENYTIWWENVLYNNREEYPVFVTDVQGRFWGEIDCMEDYERLQAHFANRE